MVLFATFAEDVGPKDEVLGLCVRIEE